MSSTPGGWRPAVGLCDRCRYHRTTGNRRGSIFHLCGRSATDPRFPKYPPLPVLRCAGFEPLDTPGRVEGTPAPSEEA